MPFREHARHDRHRSITPSTHTSPTLIPSALIRVSTTGSSHRREALDVTRVTWYGVHALVACSAPLIVRQREAAPYCNHTTASGQPVAKAVWIAYTQSAHGLGGSLVQRAPRMLSYAPGGLRSSIPTTRGATV